MAIKHRKIALLSCVKKKLSTPAPAKDLYISPLFQKSQEWAERNCTAWFILSARYGFVLPSSRLKPYEQTLKSLSEQEKREWALDVFSQMKERGILKPGVQFIWLAGRDYKEHLSLLLNQYPQLDPMNGMKMGKRLQWLNKKIERDS